MSGIHITAANFNAATMLMHIVTTMPQLTRMVTAIGFVTGMFLIMKGILGLKHLGEMQSMYRQEHGMKEPLIYMFIGALLLYLPSTVHNLLSTFWTTPCPYCYIDYHEHSDPIITACFIAVQFIGVVSVVRGLMTLSHAGANRGQPGMVSRGLIQLTAGAFCVNFYQFVQVIFISLGLSA